MIGAPRGRTIAAREPSPLSPVLPTAVKPHPTPLPPIVGISSMATRPVLAELGVAYEQATGQRVAIEAVGGVDAARRVAAGEAFDVVMLAADALDRLRA